MKDFIVRQRTLVIVVVVILFTASLLTNFPNYARYKVESLIGTFNPYVTVYSIAISQQGDVSKTYILDGLDFDDVLYDAVSDTYTVFLPFDFEVKDVDSWMILQGWANGFGNIVLLQDDEVKNNRIKPELNTDSVWSDLYAVHRYTALWKEESIQLGKVYKYTVIFNEEVKSVKVKFDKQF